MNASARCTSGQPVAHADLAGTGRAAPDRAVRLGTGAHVPVRVTNLTVTEKLYDAALLNPTHVEAQIGLRVLTAEELKCIHGPLGTLARTAYGYSQALRQTRARANVANAVESIIGMLPI
jgi:hypothetical protein